MYSKYLKKFLNKEVMIQVISGEEGLIIYNCILEHVDKGVCVVSLPEYDKKYIVNIKNIELIGVGDFHPPEKQEPNNKPTGYA